MTTTQIRHRNFTSSFAMLILALSPMLHYYNIGSTKISILALLCSLIFSINLFKGKIKASTLPNSYWSYWGWCAIQMYLIAGIAGWSDYLPGGILLCLFSMCLMGMIPSFNYHQLFKFMKWTFIIASVLMIYQHILYLATGIPICLLPHLTNDIGGFTYEEMVQRHINSGGAGRFCSIFMEPSYMGQYGLVLLTMELFRSANINKPASGFAVFIGIVLLILRSGAGLLGMAIIAIVKIAYIIFVTRQSRYYLLLALLIPITIVGIKYYLDSSAGAYVASRVAELDSNSEGTSGFVRLFYGWNMFSELSIKEMILGTSRNIATKAYESGFSNMFTYIATSQGLIGLNLLLLFYIRACRMQPFQITALVISLIIVGLIEACFLGGLMLIITTVAVAAKQSHSYL